MNQNSPLTGAASSDAGKGSPADSHSAVPADKVMEHLWRYFALHAQQRISVFNFFVVLSGVIAAGIGGALQAGRPLILLVVVLGLLLALLSFVFWRLDQRNSDLIKISERALRKGEEACFPDYARIFIRESVAGTSEAPDDDCVPQTTWTFRKSFRLIFIVMGLAGIFASGYSLNRWFYEPPTEVAGPRRTEPSSRADARSDGPPASPVGSTSAESADKIVPRQAKDSAGSTPPALQPEPASEKGTAPKN